MDSQQKGTKFNDIIGTWEQNEKDRENGKAIGKEDGVAKEDTATNDIQQEIEREAAEYNDDNKENGILSRDPATANDDAAHNNSNNK